MISGGLFPENISAAEIMLSVKYGTRMRTSNPIENTKMVATLLSEIRNILRDKIEGISKNNVKLCGTLLADQISKTSALRFSYI